MSFQLTIAEGKEAGKEFVFEQDSVLIGRVDECDVVLYDSGISRRHCRIFLEADQYFVEDVGSSNGTRVNGNGVKAKQPLTEGDKLALGPVVFVFKPVESEEEEPAAAPSAAADDPSTRIVSVEEVARKRSRNKGEALAPEGANEAQLNAVKRTATRAMPAMRASGRTGVQPALPSGAPPRPSRASPAPAALERTKDKESAPAAPSRRAGSGAVARASTSSSPGGLSAAERARIRRESPGVLGTFKLFWADARPLVRNAIIGAGGLVGLGLVAMVYWLVLGSEHQVARGPEPTMLNKRIPDSFGLGDDVMWERADQKVFEWEYAAATRTLGILHFQAQGISEGEVVVTINGVDLGKVPPDTLASSDRIIDMVIPWQLLKKGETNRITFDNTKNPPGEDPWRIWNIRLEKVPLPEIPPEQLVEEARKVYARGRKNMENADVGARNRYEAWKSFREAWLLLEAHPEPRPDLYFEAQARVKEAQKELDRVCSKLMLEVEGYVNKSSWQEASATLDHAREYFPDDNDQSCAYKAELKRAELGL